MPPPKIGLIYNPILPPIGGHPSISDSKKKTSKSQIATLGEELLHLKRPVFFPQTEGGGRNVKTRPCLEVQDT